MPLLPRLPGRMVLMSAAAHKKAAFDQFERLLLAGQKQPAGRGNSLFLGKPLQVPRRVMFRVDRVRSSAARALSRSVIAVLAVTLGGCCSGFVIEDLEFLPGERGLPDGVVGQQYAARLLASETWLGANATTAVPSTWQVVGGRASARSRTPKRFWELRFRWHWRFSYCRR